MSEYSKRNANHTFPEYSNVLFPPTTSPKPEDIQLTIAELKILTFEKSHTMLCSTIHNNNRKWF